MKHPNNTQDPLRELFLKIDGLQNQVNNINKRFDAKLIPPVSEDIIRLPEAALFLGLSQSRIHSLCSLKKVPHFKKGRIYFSKIELTKWIESGRVYAGARYELLADMLLNKKAVING